MSNKETYQKAYDKLYKDVYVGEETGTIYYNEDILSNLKKLRDFIKRVKTQDYYVRGYEDQRVVQLETIDYLIKQQEEVCDE